MKKVSKTKAAYIAGFFDGEGTIWCNVSLHHSGVRIRIAQKRPKVLYWIVQTTGFGKVHKPSRGCQHFYLSGSSKVEKFLYLVLPYVKVKLKEAKLVLRYIKLIGKPGQIQSKNNYNRRALLWKRIRRLRHV